MDNSNNASSCCVDLSDILKTIEPSKVKCDTRNRLEQYKQNKAVPSQDDRRRQFLQSVKDRRHDFIAHARLIALGDEDDDDDNEDCEDMETTADRTSYRKGRRKKQKWYLRNQLMLSEWLVQLPEDLENNWLMVLCPVGKRCLVVASRGRTKAFSRTGQHLCHFSSLLPGGNARSDRSTYSILDCLFCKSQNMFYVLDVMCWQGHPVYDCDTTFRSYWLHTKLEEIPNLNTISIGNQKSFVGLKYYACSQQTIQEVLSSPIPYELDGLLFYYKECPYMQSVTPLVGWLKAFMLQEIMPFIVVPESLCMDRPKDYISIQQYLVKAYKKEQQMECDQ